MSNLIPTERPRDPLEAQAGVGLTLAYWREPLKTPFGELSRRSVVLTWVGVLLSLLAIGAGISWRIAQPPPLQELPNSDALTVTRHVYANFSGNKSSQIQPFLILEGQALNWRYEPDGAYTFTWISEDGQEKTVLITSYTRLEDALADYDDHTRSVDFLNRSLAVSSSADMFIELRNNPNFGGEYRGLWLHNVLLLVSPSVNSAEWEELQSHFISIVSAEQREIIPSPTP